MTKIAGHELTNAERRTLDALQDYMRDNAGDSQASNSTSPKGDGRSVSLYEIFPRSAQGTASRRTAERLQRLGVLAPCEMKIERCMVSFVPLRFGTTNVDELPVSPV